MTDFTFFTTSPTGGGAEKVFTSLARKFSKEGYETELLVLNKGKAEYNPGEATVIELQSNRIRYAIPELIEYINNRSPQAVYTTLTGPNIAILIANKIASTDTQVITREATTRSISAKRRSGIKSKIENQALRSLYPTADAVVALSDDARRDLEEFVWGDGSNIIKIPNPVDIDQIRSMSEEPVSHKWFTDSNTIILGVGRLVPKNDFKTLLQAFDEFKSNSSEKLIILGDGRKRDELQSFVAEKGINDVRFLGYVDNPYKYMARADVFALTSKYEGMPNTVIEALTCGTPVVATDSPGGTSEILKQGRYGRLAEVGDVNRISQLLAGTLDSEIDQEKLMRYSESHSIENIYRSYLDLAELK
ncbi:glycosyltransferase [Natrialbaceae archaeon A-gly3]